MRRTLLILLVLASAYGTSRLAAQDVTTDLAQFLRCLRSGSICIGSTNVGAGTTLPATCATGDVYTKTTATVGIYYCSATNTWTQTSAAGSGAPTDATYITKTANSTLSAEQALASLSTGLMKVTTGTGTISIAVAGTDYVAAGAVANLVLTGTLFAALGTPADGTMLYCSDCTIANPCAGSGTGAFAKRLAAVWVCN